MNRLDIILLSLLFLGCYDKVQSIPDPVDSIIGDVRDFELPDVVPIWDMMLVDLLESDLEVYVADVQVIDVIDLGDSCEEVDRDCYPINQEGLAWGLYSKCRLGKIDCVEGSSVCTSYILPGQEECNTIDDDCDGLIDEYSAFTDLRCWLGAPGPCSLGKTFCLDGKITCFPDFPEEQCNYRDDDCDGFTDEGCLGYPCQGDQDCIGDFYCDPNGRCSRLCSLEHNDICDRCVNCLINLVLDDNQPPMELPCEELCNLCVSLCSPFDAMCVPVNDEGWRCRSYCMDDECLFGMTCRQTLLPEDGWQSEAYICMEDI